MEPDVAKAPLVPQNKKVIKRGFVVGLAVVSLAGVGFGVYVWQHTKLTDQEKQSMTLKNEKNALSDKNQQLAAEVSKLKTVPVTPASVTTFSADDSAYPFTFTYPATWTRSHDFPIVKDRRGEPVKHYSIALIQPGTVVEETLFGNEDTTQGARIVLYVTKTDSTDVANKLTTGIYKFATGATTTSVAGVKAIEYTFAYESEDGLYTSFIKNGYEYTLVLFASGEPKDSPAVSTYRALLSSFKFK